MQNALPVCHLKLMGALYEGPAGKLAVFDLMGQTLKALQELARLDETFNVVEQVESIYYGVEDLADLEA